MIDLTNIPKLPQRQDSTYHQLLDLESVANRLGMQDAAEIIRRHIEQINSKMCCSVVAHRKEENDTK